ncbi:amidohydrolase family protein [Mycobacterium sp. E2479]|uniref:N-acyl-D-amino-acid deacylase family protein n=1 Tax=Mycobacterium sp. E2479 TaxID=1834134 RepID=UPI0007FF7CFC|nr:amidohydrolase family protein [Mycobacterium sp. E2479]OBH49256.1 hypothetical protein A5686_15345 [Mycobacterium sp. E2479]
MAYDAIIRNCRWFDGTGAPSSIRHVGIRNGHIARISAGELDESGCSHVIDGAGKWAIPGMIDIHTHYDVEVLDGPALSESLRHGVTTVLIGSCSLSTVHVGGVGAGDLFGRVEAIPREHVIEAVDRHKTWSTAEEYIEALESRPLGPNMAAFLGHSDMRTAVMGLDRATRDDVRPTGAELAQMEKWLGEALDAGFVGLSSQQLKFDKLDGEACRSRMLPSTYARRRELRRLKTLVRRRRRVLQSGPDIENPLNMLSQMVQSLGVFRKNLKTTLLAAADAKSNPLSPYILRPPARLVNKLGGDFRWQHLPVPFEVYADGIDFVIFEEFGAGCLAQHVQDSPERNEMLRDESYRRRFRKDYEKKMGIRVWHRNFFDAEIVSCPDASVIGKSFGEVGIERGGMHPVDAFLDLVLEHGRALRWRTTISNHRPKVLKKFATDPSVQMGFSDAGAHLRNMAFYNNGLRFLKHVRDAEIAGRPFMSIEAAVHRMTGDLGSWYGIDAGHLREGDRADLILIDPEKLDERLETYAEAKIDHFGGLSRMVNRNDETVTAVMVSGRMAFVNGEPTPIVGTERIGSFLRAGQKTPAVPAHRAELSDVG